MFNLPDNAFVNKIVAKNKFKSKLKNIKKIIWLYSLSEKRINIPPTSKIKEIQIFKVIFHTVNVVKKDLLLIQKEIPYPVLFELNSGYAIFDKNIYYFKEAINPDFTANNMEELYKNILKSFFIVQGKDFETLKLLDLKIKALQKDMDLIKSKIKKEKQFKYKVELNKQLMQLQKELKTLKGEK